MMTDHAPRIRAEQRQAADNAAIADLERRSAPLQWAIIAAVLTVCLWQGGEWLTERIERYYELAAQGEAFAQCLNGQAYLIDNAVVRCEWDKRQLVPGLGGAR